MLEHYFRAGNFAVNFAVLSAAERVRFVHTDIHAPRRKTFGERFENMLDEFVRSFVVREQNIRGIANPRVLFPPKNAAKVRQRLYARHEFHAASHGNTVDFL